DQKARIQEQRKGEHLLIQAPGNLADLQREMDLSFYRQVNKQGKGDGRISEGIELDEEIKIRNQFPDKQYDQDRYDQSPLNLFQEIGEDRFAHIPGIYFQDTE